MKKQLFFFGRLHFFFHEMSVLFNSLKTFRAYNVLHSTGIFSSSFGIYAQLFKPGTEKTMTLIYFISDCLAGGSKGNKSLMIHLNISVQTEIFHGHTDTGLGKIQFIGNINRTYLGLAVPDY